PNVVRHVQQLVNGGPPPVARKIANLASGRGVEHLAPVLVRIEPRFRKFLVARVVLAAAIVAQYANKALGQNTIQRRYEIVGLHPHVQEPADDVDDVVGVHGREHQVPGEGRLDRDLGRFRISNLADHYLVGIVTQDAAQTASKGKSLFLIDRYLGYALELVFN